MQEFVRIMEIVAGVCVGLALGVIIWTRYIWRRGKRLQEP
jgi:hypothetical protein